MKKCPGCGVEALQYKGDGEFECLFCGKVFNVGGTPPEKTPAEEESEKADIPVDVDEGSSEVNEASADAEEVSSEGAPSPDEESAEEETEDAVISSAPEEEEEIAVSVPVEDADEEEIVSSVPEEESSFEESSEAVPEEEEEAAEPIPAEETPADEEADSSIPEEKEEEQVSELAEEAPAPAEEALSDNVAEEKAEGAEGESPEEEVAADSEEEASPVKEEEAPAAADNSLKTVHAQKKAALAQLLPSPMPETIYTKVMGLMMPALMILLGIFFIGFLGGSVIDVLFGSVTGYDIIEAGRYADDALFAEAYGSTAYLLSMSVIILAAAIAQLVLTLFKKTNKSLKYAFYVGYMCVLATIFVAACILVGGANDYAYAGDCIVVTLVFTILWMIALPFVYVLSITSDAPAASSYIKAYAVKTLAEVSALGAAAKAKSEAKTSPAHGGEDIPVAKAYPADDGLPKAELLDDDDDADVISTSAFAETAPAYTAYGGGGAASLGGIPYSARFDLTLDDVIESIYVRGGYAGFRILASLITFLAGIALTINLALGFGFSTGDMQYVSTAIMGPMCVLPFTALMLAVSSVKNNVGRIPINLVWMFGWWAFLAGFICICIFSFESSDSFWVNVVLGIIAGYTSPIFHAKGMGRHYDKKIPLAKPKKVMQLVVCIVFIVIIVALSVTPAIITTTDPLYKIDKVELGMTYDEVTDILGDPIEEFDEDDMNYISSITYVSSDAKKIYDKMSDVVKKAEQLEEDMMSAETWEEMESIAQEIEDLSKEYEDLMYDLEELEYSYAEISFSAPIAFEDSYVDAVVYIDNAQNDPRDYNNHYYYYSTDDWLVENSTSDRLSDDTFHVGYKRSYEDGSFMMYLCELGNVSVDQNYNGEYTVSGNYYTPLDSGTVYYSDTMSVSEWSRYMPDFEERYINIYIGGIAENVELGMSYDEVSAILGEYLVYSNGNTYTYAKSENTYYIDEDAVIVTFSSSYSDRYVTKIEYRADYDNFNSGNSGITEVELVENDENDSYPDDELFIDVTKDYSYDGNGGGYYSFIKELQEFNVTDFYDYGNSYQLYGTYIAPGNYDTTSTSFSYDLEGWRAYIPDFEDRFLFVYIGDKAEMVELGMSYDEVTDLLGSYLSYSGNTYTYAKAYSTSSIDEDVVYVTFSSSGSDRYVTKIEYHATDPDRFSGSSSYSATPLPNDRDDVFDDDRLMIAAIRNYNSDTNDNGNHSFVKELQEANVTSVSQSGNYYTIAFSYDRPNATGTNSTSETRSRSEWLDYIPEFDVFYNRVVNGRNLSYYLSYTNDSGYPFDFDSSTFELTSTNKSHNSTATFTVRVRRTCNVKFDYHVSSENNYDWFTIVVNGSQIDRISGTNSGSYSGRLSSGTEITFTYSKDGSNSNGSDCGWVDNWEVY